MEVRCCVCGKVRLEDIWTKPADPDSNLPVSHGYCPDCGDVAREEFENYRLQSEMASQ